MEWEFALGLRQGPILITPLTHFHYWRLHGGHCLCEISACLWVWVNRPGLSNISNSGLINHTLNWQNKQDTFAQANELSIALQSEPLSSHCKRSCICSPVVPLSRLLWLIWTNNQLPSISVQLAQTWPLCAVMSMWQVHHHPERQNPQYWTLILKVERQNPQYWTLILKVD